MNTREYLTDEELLRLMDRAERDGLLSAPRDLKKNALELICHSEERSDEESFSIDDEKVIADSAIRSFAALRMTGESAPGMTEERTLRMPEPTPEQKKRAAKKQFRRYCIRVGLGCAACLAVLFSAGPIGQKAQSAAESLSGISDRTSQYSTYFSDATDQISGALTNEFFGGIDHNE